MGSKRPLFFIKSEKKSSAPALQLLWCASFCVPAAKIHPALVVPIRHALGVHQLCEQTIPTVHEPQTKGFSMQIWALSWTSAYSHIALISWSETRWQSQSFPTHPSLQHTWNCLHYLFGHYLALINWKVRPSFHPCRVSAGCLPLSSSRVFCHLMFS